MKSLIFSTQMVKAILAGNKTQTRRPINPQPVGKFLKPPFKPGDVLYVKETWATYTDSSGTGYMYAAEPMFDGCEPGDIDWKWRSPMFMPQSAARIFLKVTDVRVERLGDISPDDVIAEGFALKSCEFKQYKEPAYCGCCTGCFSALWDSLYAKRPEYQWDKNPWVWKIAFERTEKP